MVTAADSTDGHAGETVSKSHKTGQDALNPKARDPVSTEQGHPALDLQAKLNYGECILSSVGTHRRGVRPAGDPVCPSPSFSALGSLPANGGFGETALPYSELPQFFESFETAFGA
jgi:hypothetical protein